MSNGKNFVRHDRRNNDNGVHADPGAAKSRQHEMERRTPPEIIWITGERELVEACKQIMHGIPGRYPVFGIKLKVEERNGPEGTYPVLAYYGALPGDDGHNLLGFIPEGFVMSPAVLTWTIGANTKFKTESHELVCRTLLSQPEMQMARNEIFREEEEAESARAQAERDAAVAGKADLLSKLRGAAKLAQPAIAHSKTDYPELTSIAEILTSQRGFFRHHSGVEILVCQGEQAVKLIRVRKIKDEAHPLFEIMKRSACARQDAIAYEDDLDPTVQLEGIQELNRFFRQWLRAELKPAGIQLKPVVTRQDDDRSVEAGEETPQGKALSVADSLTS